MLLLLLPPSVFPCASASSIAFDAQHLLHMFEVLDDLGGWFGFSETRKKEEQSARRKRGRLVKIKWEKGGDRRGGR